MIHIDLWRHNKTNTYHLNIYIYINTPDSNVHGANSGRIWGREDPGGPRVGPMN